MWAVSPVFNTEHDAIAVLLMSEVGGLNFWPAKDKPAVGSVFPTSTPKGAAGAALSFPFISHDGKKLGTNSALL